MSKGRNRDGSRDEPADQTTRLLRNGLSGNAHDFDAFIERVTPLLLAVARRCLGSLTRRGIEAGDHRYTRAA